MADLFARHGLSVTVAGRHSLAFKAASPRAYLDSELQNHPLAIAALEVLRQRGREEQARARLLQVLSDHNEDETAFRTTSRYVVYLARSS